MLSVAPVVEVPGETSSGKALWVKAAGRVGVEVDGPRVYPGVGRSMLAGERQAGVMDTARAILRFVERADQLSRLPLISDPEMDDLFGEEVAVALAELDRYNRENDVCRRCESRCCQACHCELYAPQFSRCPIQDLRPVLCRLHFCSWFGEAGGQLVKELGDIFCESLLAADRDGNARVRLFESPPLAMSAPGLVAVTVPWVEAVREGRLDAESAEKAVRREAEKYRTPVGAGAVGD